MPQNSEYKKVLVIDVGGANIKLALMPDDPERRRIPSGATCTPEIMVAGVQAAVGDWEFDAISIGFPGPIMDNCFAIEPHNLGKGWVGFDLARAFGKPAKLVNDAAMQAIGSYEGGKMLFLGLGTGLGAALVIETLCISLELAHMPYKEGKSFEDFVGQRGIDAYGQESWETTLEDVIRILKNGMVADYVILGGGNARLLTKLPDNVRLGDNTRAFLGGLRLWSDGFRIA